MIANDKLADFASSTSPTERTLVGGAARTCPVHVGGSPSNEKMAATGRKRLKSSMDHLSTTSLMAEAETISEPVKEVIYS